MKYQVTNVPHVVPVERSWKDKKVVHSLPFNVPELIGHVVPIERTWKDKKVVHSLPFNVPELIEHAVRIFLDNSHKIFLSLNCMWSWPSDSGVLVHSVDSTGKSCSLVLMVCGSRYAMNCVPSVLTNLVAT